MPRNNCHLSSSVQLRLSSLNPFFYLKQGFLEKSVISYIRQAQNILFYKSAGKLSKGIRNSGLLFLMLGTQVLRLTRLEDRGVYLKEGKDEII